METDETTTEAPQPEAAESAAPLDREAIRKMKRAELEEILEAHGVSTEGTVPELRQRAIDALFVGEIGAPVPELNQDGLIPGQEVTFEQIVAAESRRRAAERG